MKRSLPAQATIAAKSRRRLCRLHGRADRGELIGSQRLLREQQAGAFVKIGMARAQVKIGLANLAYNMRRFIWLRTRYAPA